ncbi:hypothetical protein OI18_08910 [Flavihumibacter solisilvae]|uniref:branched-chain-amino-acid transaminase n=2 Tax=Flavihumibacter solisilvae TaxID=1349421 RepID=A0A0C1L6G8_9BACT|nr:hypothetical protein OI18_08910 [Flavihumibacter solisilvae]
MDYAIINGKLIEAGEAALLVNDLSIQRGYGIFDFFKVVDGEPVFLGEHLDRFYASAAKMRLEPSVTRAQLISDIHTLLAKNNVPESGIRLTLTGGYSEDGYSQSDPNLVITQSALSLNRELPAGMSIITHEFQRQLPQVKTIDYLMAIWLQPLIKQSGAADVLYHSGGNITECPRANFFIVTSDGEIATPKENILAGVTRAHVIKLAGRKYNVRERDIHLSELEDASEAFITSTTKHVLPVTEINGKKVGDGRAGEITTWLSDAYNQLVFPAKLSK